MIKSILSSIVVFLWLSILNSVIVMAAPSSSYKIGYFEHGYFSSYEGIFKAFKQALIDKNWDDLFEFPADAQISPGTKDMAILKAKAQQLLDRKDLAAIIVMGTSATRAIYNLPNPQKIPIFADAVSDANEFITNERDSGQDYFTVRVIPNYYKRMFGIFHSEVLFKKLGLMYTTLSERNNLTGLDDAEAVAEEKGFTIVSFSLADHGLPNTTDGCLTGLKELVTQGIDAFFIPALECFEWKKSQVKPLIDFLITKKIRTFSKQGARDVKAGAMMGYSASDFPATGSLLADKLHKVVVEQEKPRTLPMIDTSLPKLILNLDVAAKIGYQFSFDILGASDEVYETISLPVDRLK